MKRLSLAAMLIAGLNLGPASAQDYPSRQITLVVPVAAGGAVDYLGRIIAEHLAKSFGKPVVVENRTGAGMVTGSLSVAKAPADGHTLLLGTAASHAINASLHKQLAYDPVKDFVPVAHFANSPFALIVNPALPVKSVPELVVYSKTNPLSYASAGPGSPQHLFAELLKTETGAAMNHVPYRGNVPAMTDIVAGHVQVFFSDPSGFSLIRDGKVRALGLSSGARVAVLPDVPPLAEAGLPGFDAVAWLMLFAPAGTSPEIVARLNREVRALSEKPETQALIEKNGQIPVRTPEPALLKDFVAAEVARWRKVVEGAGIAGSL